MPIRNLFRRPALEVHDENLAIGTNTTPESKRSGATSPSRLEIQKPVEYKMSEINDSGVYLPPSPPEEKRSWLSRSTVSVSSRERSLLSENEPFNISRESFDSYRRSFDISARSPITDDRRSFDSRTLSFPRARHPPPSSRNGPQPPIPDAELEDVSLHDEPKPRKKGLFARFGESSDSQPGADVRPYSGHSHLPALFGGRKRGQSGQGAELAPVVKSTAEAGPVAELRND